MKRNKKNSARKNYRLALGMSIVVIIVVLLFSASSVNASSEVYSDNYKYYTTIYVDRDTTLWGIAQEYITEEYSDIYVYMDEVKKINSLSSDELEYGTTICVPYYSGEYK